MKKLFISCPMRGRTEDNIKLTMEKMHKIAEVIFGEELEMINTLIPPDRDLPDGTRDDVWCLGRSIQMIASADYYIGLYGVHDFNGCCIENEISYRYFHPKHRAMFDVEALRMADLNGVNTVCPAEAKDA